MSRFDDRAPRQVIAEFDRFIRTGPRPTSNGTGGIDDLTDALQAEQVRRVAGDLGELTWADLLREEMCAVLSIPANREEDLHQRLCQAMGMMLAWIYTLNQQARYARPIPRRRRGFLGRR
jgi:hypothetical protein